MSYEKGYVATLAELEDFYRGKHAGDIIELMNQTNDIISDVKWIESNQSDGHLTRIRTGLPEVYWRRLYRGTPPSKSKVAQVKEACGMLEARMELDIAEIELYGDRAKAFRLSEAMAFAEAMRQKVAQTLFYGDHNRNAEEFNGLCMRYPSPASPHVLDAGGKGNRCTSAWLICWGASTAHGIYPKGSVAGLSTHDDGDYVTTDDEGRKFRCVGDTWTWKCGLAVRDWRSVVRIINIDTAKLALRKGQAGFIDLQALTIKAKNMMPENMRNQAIWYVNQDVLTALELQSTDAGNVHLVYGEAFASKAVPNLHGRPIRQCDVIRSDEKTAPAQEGE